MSNFDKFFTLIIIPTIFFLAGYYISVQDKTNYQKVKQELKIELMQELKTKK